MSDLSMAWSHLRNDLEKWSGKDFLVKQAFEKLSSKEQEGAKMDLGHVRATHDLIKLLARAWNRNLESKLAELKMSDTTPFDKTLSEIVSQEK
jgi:hypothetical protein